MNARDILTWLSRHVAPGANLCLDTRQLNAGDVFFACPGLASDGRSYIEQAVRQGAAAIVAHASADSSINASVPVLEVEGLTDLLGQIAHRWYGEPSGAMSVVALTGTNGKTSCVQWLASALNTDGVPCGTIGTLGVTLADGTNLGGALTTPDVLTMHRSLAAMRKAGVQVVAIEASSIGLTQGRLDHVQIQIAGFTNLTHDHLDYHHSMEAYKAAKFRLFDWPGLRCSVINLDDAAGEELAGLLPASSVAGYTTRNHAQASLRAQDIQAGPYGLVFNLVTPEGTAQMLTRLVGEHNVSNLLQVAGVLRDLGWDLQRIARVLGGLTSVEGRLQVVDTPDAIRAGVGCPMVVVDYAHTPDALERALRALRDIATARRGKLVCVFGCGGSRDSSKRPIMGRIAAERADAVVLTSDNPRNEDPIKITEQVIAGMPQVPQVPQVDLDRANAILSVIWDASPDDVILIAGKGHETYQETEGIRRPFDDREWARFALSWRQGLSISTDTRNVAPGQLFVALKGDTFDGHDYLEVARAAGACAAVVEQKNPAADLHQFALGDTRQALIRVATAWRRRFGIPTIAVTGSNGKTTTKEMIASILRSWLGEESSLATRGNLNNDIGVPLTVLRLTAQHEAAVIELGMNHPGEIAVLAAVAQPTVALVNNAQREHQEFLHSVEAVARENGSVLDALSDAGTAVFPGDDAYTSYWTGRAAGRKVVRFGFEREFEVYADQIHVESDGTSFQIHTPAGATGVTLAAPGVHNLRNALAAAACTLAAGAPLQAITQGLGAFRPVRGRMQPRAMAGGFQLIDDTYNANPDSVRAAIDVLAQLKGRKVLVLGDMGEVGADSHAMHAEVGSYAKDQGIDALLVHGVACVHAAQAFGAQAFVFDSIDDLLSGIGPWMPAHVLVKGSRSARMERVVAALSDQTPKIEEGGHDAA